MIRLTHALAVVASLTLAGGAVNVAAATRPDDRPTHGPGAVSAGTSADVLRPDDRGWRGTGPEPTIEVVESPTVLVDGFDWVDAGIGASASLGLVLVAGGAVLFMRRGRLKAIVTAAIVTGIAAGTAFATQTTWAGAQKLDEVAGNHPDVNTPSLDGCPIQSPDGLSLYMASNRPGGKGGLDIWIATRASANAAWGAPTNPGEPVNSAADDFCPTPVGKQGLFFVSREALPGACGQGDIYYTHRTGTTWREPERLLCAPAGPNSALDEQGPSWVDPTGKLRGKKQLYFSRSSAPPLQSVPGELFVSERQNGARFGPAIAVTELNDAAANDIQPHVRADGLEIVFTSNRAGTLGGQDLWAATRATPTAAWSAPVNLGSAVNTAAGETRPSLSKDGTQLLFGRAPGPEGSSDIYVTTRP